jgi:putative transcriptional regulator
MPMTEKELLERDAKRDIAQEFLQSVREMKAGIRGREHSVAVSPVIYNRCPARHT